MARVVSADGKSLLSMPALKNGIKNRKWLMGGTMTIGAAGKIVVFRDA